MNARTLMIQGTASSVGKSLLVTGLCRWFARNGYRVAPYKSQNMALNAFVTADGLEVGRAQAVQAHAAGIEVTVDMNPVLLKPESDKRCQVVVMGRAAGERGAAEYHDYKQNLAPVVAESLARLRAQYDVVLIEGAGSPAEINLRERDIVNMHVAHEADAPVLLVGDIDRGGVFAAFVGTLALLDDRDRARIAGFVVNKFRGELSLLTPGLEMLTERTGLPVLGVVPVVRDLRVADEDSLSMDDHSRRRAAPDELDICIVRYPRTSNHDDFSALEHEAKVVVRYIDRPGDCEGADLVILPGSKNTRGDLAWLRERGFEDVLQRRAENGEPVLGVCGGFQMLGGAIDDPQGLEGVPGEARGLGLLDVRTLFDGSKVLRRVEATTASPSFLVSDSAAQASGYEIHTGRVIAADGLQPCFLVNGEAEGAVAGSVVGTLLHGVFESRDLRFALLKNLRERRGLPEPPESTVSDFEAEYDRLADALDDALDMPRILEIMGFATR